MSINKPVDQYELARQIHKHYKSLSTDKFKNQIQRDGVNYRKAMYLVSVINRQKALGYTAKETRKLMRELGWTRVSVMMLSMAKKRSVTTLVRRYKDATVPVVKKAFPSPNSRTGSWYDKLFAVHMKQAQYNKLLRSLKEHGMKTGGRNFGVSDAFEQLVNGL